MLQRLRYAELDDQQWYLEQETLYFFIAELMFPQRFIER